ncbi:gamma-glutamyltransferase [Pacificimonas flava]|uniref:Gamma-glutamyltransferase n=2 Tax=Pacificimonas TaxID=1960290 RepID=A0A219B326_9SPHN|nr:MULTISPECIES: gamma-glutamyltransferase family protein [Pacificimonas]MBZ6377751.1 gamma-glutamyltransferase family protein [Pacificimonas aurantium]OWV32574.1 gamma-glutamyltransferase [Pacificimonas flava]
MKHQLSRALPRVSATTFAAAAVLALGAPAAAQLGPATAPAAKDLGDRYSGFSGQTRSPVLGKNSMVATSQPLATQIGLDVLKAGGSAVDAAIAANAALGLMEPTGNGIGGDLFAIVWDPETEQLYGLNASGRAPMGQTLEQLRAASAEAGDANDIPEFGWRSVTIPGAVSGWGKLHERFGRMPFAAVLAPAIYYAETGFPVSELISYYWNVGPDRYRDFCASGVIEECDNANRLYFGGGDNPPDVGDVFANPDLARTLKTIAAEGPEAFYKGELARDMAAYLERIGAPHRYEDFASHEANWVEPVSVDYRGYDVWELPPNGQGIAALQMLTILEGYDLASMGRDSDEFWHLMTEAKKLAFADRARFYADPDFVETPVERLLSEDYAAERRELIGDRAMMEADPGLDTSAIAVGDTIYLTTADSSGMMVSLIQSNYRGMGSGLVPDDGEGNTLGFMFQDRGAQFALAEGHPNVYAPGKRPFHTIIPAFVTKDGQPWMSFGLMGGAMQPQGHAQIVVNMVDFGMNVQAAGDAARFHHVQADDATALGRMSDGGVLQVESGVPLETVRQLEARGHQVEYTTGPFGGYQAIWKDPETGVYWGASEMRKDGQAAGY